MLKVLCRSLRPEGPCAARRALNDDQLRHVNQEAMCCFEVVLCGRDLVFLALPPPIKPENQHIS